MVHVFFAGVMIHLMYGQRKDPYQASEDRDRQIGIGVKSIIFIGIAATLFVTLEIGLHAFELQDLSAITTSLYFQLLALVSFREFCIEEADFEIYRMDPVAT